MPNSMLTINISSFCVPLSKDVSVNPRDKLTPIMMTRLCHCQCLDIVNTSYYLNVYYDIAPFIRQCVLAAASSAFLITGVCVHDQHLCYQMNREGNCSDFIYTMHYHNVMAFPRQIPILRLHPQMCTSGAITTPAHGRNLSSCTNMYSKNCFLPSPLGPAKTSHKRQVVCEMSVAKTFGYFQDRTQCLQYSGYPHFRDSTRRSSTAFKFPMFLAV